MHSIPFLLRMYAATTSNVGLIHSKFKRSLAVHRTEVVQLAWILQENHRKTFYRATLTMLEVIIRCDMDSFINVRAVIIKPNISSYSQLSALCSCLWSWWPTVPHWKRMHSWCSCTDNFDIYKVFFSSSTNRDTKLILYLYWKRIIFL